jgi:hypothetical protein
MNESAQYTYFELIELVAFSSICILGVYIVALKPFAKLNLEGLMDNRICNNSISDCSCLINQRYDPEPLANFTHEDRYQIQKSIKIINHAYSQKYHTAYCSLS